MISVCIPSYNGEKYINHQLTSILDQLSPIDEVVISDDSSTDDTIKIIESMNDKRIVLLKNNKFRSPCYNMENAINYSKGDIIFLADQDDIWEEQKLEIMTKFLKNADLVLSDCFIVDSENNIISDSFYQLMNSKSGFIKNLYKNSFIGCCIGFKRHVLEWALPFPNRLPMHDIWIGLIVEMLGKTLFIDDKLLRYRRHGGNASFTGGRSQYSFYYKVSYRLDLLTKLLIRYFKVKYHCCLNTNKKLI